MLLLASSVCGLFKWRQFEPEVILLAVGWYLRFSLSYRDVEELLAERALPADHVTVWRWAQRYAPETERTLLAPISTAVDSCVPTKLSLHAFGLCCSLRVVREAWLRHRGLTGAPQLQRPDFWRRVSLLGRLNLKSHSKQRRPTRLKVFLGCSQIMWAHSHSSYEADVVKPLTCFFRFLHHFRWFLHLADASEERANIC
jgi:hypothetical protein